MRWTNVPEARKAPAGQAGHGSICRENQARNRVLTHFSRAMEQGPVVVAAFGPTEEVMATRMSRKVEAVDLHLNPRTITIDPLTPVIGAEIGGIDLSKPIPPAQ